MQLHIKTKQSASPVIGLPVSAGYCQSLNVYMVIVSTLLWKKWQQTTLKTSRSTSKITDMHFHPCLSQTSWQRWNKNAHVLFLSWFSTILSIYPVSYFLCNSCSLINYWSLYICSKLSWFIEYANRQEMWRQGWDLAWEFCRATQPSTSILYVVLLLALPQWRLIDSEV